MSILKDIITNVVGEAGVEGLVKAFAVELRNHAKDAGTACSMPGCDALTLGTRCECTRRICGSHTYWRLAKIELKVPRIHPFCVYCVVAQNENMFSDGDAADE
jgi:hypothetical protein